MNSNNVVVIRSCGSKLSAGSGTASGGGDVPDIATEQARFFRIAFEHFQGRKLGEDYVAGDFGRGAGAVMDALINDGSMPGTSTF